MSEKDHDFNPNAPTVIELRDPADRPGGNSIIHQRFKQVEPSLSDSSTVIGLPPEFRHIIEEEKRLAEERAREASILAVENAKKARLEAAENAKKASRRSSLRTIRAFVYGAVLGVAGGWFLNRGVETPPLFFSAKSEKPKSENPPSGPKPEKSGVNRNRELLRAEFLQSKGRQKEAMAIVESLLAENPEDIYLLYRKAQILEEWGRKWKALNLLEEILKKDDGDKLFLQIKIHRNELKSELKGESDQ